jgi:hypothetical protein
MQLKLQQLLHKAFEQLLFAVALLQRILSDHSHVAETA